MVNIFSRKYFLNPETLRFERVKLSLRQRLRYSLLFSLGLIVLAVVLRFGFERYYPTPRQLIYERNNTTLRSDYATLNTQLLGVESQLSELRNRDDRFYRSILSLKPVPASIREAGTGGSEPYGQFRNLREPGMVLDVFQRIDKISNRVQIQSSSLEDVYKEAVMNQHFVACKPSINPISSADQFWMTSSYGYRNDPFTHRRTPHYGIDLAGPYGLKIHATGEGTVISTGFSKYGYGKEVLIDHGYGYTSRYAHLKEILVKPGQKLNRGEVLGTLGSTGRSTGPHLHYEVRKNGHTVNPMYFFFENLSAREYSLLATRATLPEGVYKPNAMSQK
ncbi:MAG: peptidoglycan DD-metalloendopeptidase family protein [Bacteroidales bacterium]|nr:peptidoglycan DD-metalloendopeptidase family protein [Bacteroidales bacterium]